MIKAAILDVDGVLFDSMPIWKDAGAKYLRSIHVIPEENLGEILWDMSLAEGVAYMKRFYALTESEEMISEGILTVIREFYEKEAPLKPGVIPFLEELQKRGIPMVIVTSGDRSYLDKAFARTGIHKYIKRVFTCDEVGAGKTNPLIYQEAAAYLGEKPEDIAVFEDADYAVKTAKSANFLVVGMYDDSGKNETLAIQRTADIYLHDFSQADIFWRYFE